MNIETKEALALLGAVSGIVIPLLTSAIKKAFSNRLKEEEFEEEVKPDGSYKTKRRKKYK